MNINEVEGTLKSLIARHPNLDEAMLTTLLESGGWDEKMIREAVSLFSGKKIIKQPISNAPAFIPNEEVSVLPVSISEDHQLLEHNLVVETEEKEPQTIK